MPRRNVSFVMRAIASELHRPMRKNFQRRYTSVSSLTQLLQADLVEMQPYAKANKGYRYLLTVINVFSKYAWARPIEKKDAKCVTKAMKNILDSADGRLFKPTRFLQTDKGNEFFNKKFLNMLKTYNTKLYATFGEKKAACVERFNRTLKTKNVA